jgi:hypothetical protein
MGVCRKLFEEELDEISQFYDEVFRFVGTETVFKNYENMNEESRRKYREKLTLNIIFKHSPKRNYGISKAEIRETVGDMIDYYRKVLADGT